MHRSGRTIPPVRLLVDGIAAYRLTRLVTADVITQPIRDRIIEAAYVQQGRAELLRHSATGGGVIHVDEEGAWQQIADADPVPPKLAELVTCRWCAGVWVAFGILLVRRTRWWPHVADAMAMSAAAALLARVED